MAARGRGAAARRRRPLRRPSPTRSATAWPSAGGNASVWLTQFDDFLKVLRLAHRGHRRHEHPVVDREPGLTARPDPQLPRDGRAARLREGGDRGACRARRGDRRRALAADAARCSARSTSCSRSTRSANFAWWNEDHNYYIDLRASIPLRRGSAGARRGLSTPTQYDDALFLFFPEASTCARPQAVEGPAVDRRPLATSTTTTTTRSATPSRRSSARCPTRSKIRCSSRSSGCTTTTSRRMKSDRPSTQMSGFPASAGTVSGRARVMLSATELSRSRGGRDPRVRGDVAELDSRVRPHRRAASATAAARSPTPRS